eukprot:jgi/Ulvmu1/7020/UM033_0079.1
MSLQQDCQASDGRAHGSSAGVVPANGVSAQRVHGFQDGDRVIARPSFLPQNDRRIAVVVGSRSSSSGTECFVVYDDFDRRCAEWRLSSNLELCTPDAEVELKRKRDAAEQPQPSYLKSRRHAQKSLSVGMGGERTSSHEHSHPCLPRYIEKVDFGQYELPTWYHSPLPPPYATMKHLFICPYTLKYFQKRRTLDAHIRSIAIEHRHPPGECIYASPPPPPGNAVLDTGPKITAVCEPQVVVYKIDGLKYKLFCQNLCLFSRMFLDGKTLIWEVYEFVFYVFCEVLPNGQEMFGYFSREKQNESNHLACILTMPHKQRKGYGGLIIDFSYEIARMDGKPGTPERPLSDLGQIAFREYWERTLVSRLLDMSNSGYQDVELGELARTTGVSKDDIAETLGKNSRLHQLKLLRFGHGSHAVHLDYDVLFQLYQLLCANKHRLIVDSTCFVHIS